MATLQLISQAKSDPENSKNVPTMEIVVNKGIATPAGKAASMVVILKGLPKRPATIDAGAVPDLVRLVILPESMKPKWNLTVKIYPETKLTNGQDVYIYTLLSFRDFSGERIPAGDINEGDWLFPIVVNDDNNNEYLLAQVHVKITSAAAPAANPSDNKTTATKPAADKLSADKFTAEKFAANKVSADKFTAEKFVAEKVTADKVTADKITKDKPAS